MAALVADFDAERSSGRGGGTGAVALPRTSTEIVACLARLQARRPARRCGRGGCAGTRKSRSPTVRDARPRRRLRRSSARRPREPAARRRGRSAAASGPGRRAAAPRRARDRPAKRTHYCAASSHHQLGWPPSWVSISTPSGTWGSISSSGIGASSPAITVTISAPSASCSIVAARVEPGAAPGDDLAVGEADRVALAEAALGVVAGGRGDAAGRRSSPSASSSRSAFSADRGVRVELDQGQQARLLRGRRRPPGPASRRARRRARRP